jgi:hypothetical protein
MFTDLKGDDLLDPRMPTISVGFPKSPKTSETAVDASHLVVTSGDKDEISVGILGDTILEPCWVVHIHSQEFVKGQKIRLRENPD